MPAQRTTFFIGFKLFDPEFFIGFKLFDPDRCSTRGPLIGLCKPNSSWLV